MILLKCMGAMLRLFTFLYVGEVIQDKNRFKGICRLIRCSEASFIVLLLMCGFMECFSSYFGAVHMRFGSPCTLFRAVSPLYGALFIYFGAVHPLFGSPCALFGADSSLYGALSIYFGAVHPLFGSPSLYLEQFPQFMERFSLILEHFTCGFDYLASLFERIPLK